MAGIDQHNFFVFVKKPQYTRYDEQWQSQNIEKWLHVTASKLQTLHQKDIRTTCSLSKRTTTEHTSLLLTICSLDAVTV